MILVFIEKGRTQNLHFWSKVDPPEDGRNQKILTVVQKNFSHWAIQMCKIKALSTLSFPRKIRLLIALFGLFLAGDSAGHKSKGHNQVIISSFLRL